MRDDLERTCPVCLGQGYRVVPRGLDSKGYVVKKATECARCGGTGRP